MKDNETKKEGSIRVSGNASITITSLDGSSKVLHEGEYSSADLESVSDTIIKKKEESPIVCTRFEA